MVVMQVALNGKEETVPVDTGCGHALLCHAEGPWLSEIMQLNCIQGDVRKYPTVRVRLQVAGWWFRCVVKVVPQLDCPVLIGWDCPILTQLMQEQTGEVEAKMEPLPAMLGHLWHQEDPTLRHAWYIVRADRG